MISLHGVLKLANGRGVERLSTSFANSRKEEKNMEKAIKIVPSPHLIRGILRSKGITIEQYAKVIDRSFATTQSRLAGVTDFTAPEIASTCNFIHEDPSIFFTKDLDG